MAEFVQPTHTNHTFLGYRGVSRRHFVVENNKMIRYIPPPADIAGSYQLGRGVYVTSDVGKALDHAYDSAWEYYCSLHKDMSKYKDDSEVRKRFESQQWLQYGNVHAVFMPTAKVESVHQTMMDFSQINIDRQGDFVHRNMMAAIKREKKPIFALTTQYVHALQTIIYPPHTSALFVKDITTDVVEWRKK